MSVVVQCAAAVAAVVVVEAVVCVIHTVSIVPNAQSQKWFHIRRGGIVLNIRIVFVLLWIHTKR